MATFSKLANALKCTEELTNVGQKQEIHCKLFMILLHQRGVSHVEGVSRIDLKEKYSQDSAFKSNCKLSFMVLITIINSGSWNVKTEKMTPLCCYHIDFFIQWLPKYLRDAANKIMALLGDYDAIHVRRCDILKTRKDRFGVDRTLHPHLDRDTSPQFVCSFKAMNFFAGLLLLFMHEENAFWCVVCPAVHAAVEERSKGLLLLKENEINRAGVKLSNAILQRTDSEFTNEDELYIGVSKEVEINSLPDLQYQILWLKNELCTMLDCSTQ
ncbi:hypothetical protein L2E82_44699 [Cichorium intybus]|uniref:Uncharacterized protein n=1 Tax=Cichorium intybus TaxID=13427 RepID=A0ACB8ZS86_CICIN|nr:hypothetical protein L2E82_44699 [Cichorium intybus]